MRTDICDDIGCAKNTCSNVWLATDYVYWLSDINIYRDQSQWQRKVSILGGAASAGSGDKQQAVSFLSSVECR